MQDYIEFFQTNKSRTKKFKKYIKRNLGLTEDKYEDDFEYQMPSFEESFNFPNGHKDEHVCPPSSTNLKRPHKQLEFFIVPCTTPSAQPARDA